MGLWCVFYALIMLSLLQDVKACPVVSVNILSDTTPGDFEIFALRRPLFFGPVWVRVCVVARIGHGIDVPFCKFVIFQCETPNVSSRSLDIFRLPSVFSALTNATKVLISLMLLSNVYLLGIQGC